MIDWWGLAKSFIALIEMAEKNNMSMKASKTFLDPRTLSSGDIRWIRTAIALASIISDLYVL